MSDRELLTVQDESTVVVSEKEVNSVSTDNTSSVVAVEQPDGTVVLESTEQSQVAFDEESVVLSVGEQGPQGQRGERGATGFPGAGASVPVRVTVPIGSTTVIEALDMEVYRSTKWIMTVTAPFRQQFRMSEIMAFQDGVSAQHVQYAIFGAQVLYTVDVVTVGGNMVLRVTNADSEALTVDAVRVGNLSV